MDLEGCKSYSEMSKRLGYNYYNGQLKQKIIKYCEEHNIDHEKIIAENNKIEPTFCAFCGKEIKRGKKFCNSSCAAKHNNKFHVRTEESKRKTSETIRNKIKEGSIKIKNQHINQTDEFELNSTLVRKGVIQNPNNVNFRERYISLSSLVETRCVVCGKMIPLEITPNGRLSKRKTCSDECYNRLVETNSRNVAKTLIKEGRHQGWLSRNITSFAEKFWVAVLDNNNITYVKEDFSTKKYFLDFLIEKNGLKIDLEIDGKQHLYEDRKLHDIERDKFLREHGFIVYRIPWNEVKTEKGKNLMKDKITKFLSFYNSI